MHFSSPSGHRLSWWRPWNRGAVGRFSSGYWTVSTFRNICRKVTPNPLTGFRNSGTGDLLDGAARNGVGVGWRATRAGGHADTVVVRQIEGRDGEAAGALLGTGGSGSRCRGTGGWRPGSGRGRRGGGAALFRGHVA